MFGSDVTNGLFLKRSSLSVSGTTITSGCWIATEQKAMSRGVSDGFIPIFDLNHWRFSSISEIIAIGVLQMNDASRVRSSKACSGSVSRMAYFWRAATRSLSFPDAAFCASMEPPETSRRGETNPSPKTTWIILLESFEEKNDGTRRSVVACPKADKRSHKRASPHGCEPGRSTSAMILRDLVGLNV